MCSAVEQLFDNIWQDYISITPSAIKIQQLLSSGGDIINDHVAYRTFNIEKVNKAQLANHLIKLGYKECGQYKFEQKKLEASHYEHPNVQLPKVFISELLVEEFSEKTQRIIHNIVNSIADSSIADNSFLFSGRSWPLSFTDYNDLLSESEYAAWLAVWGFRANHFTVNVNYLKNFASLEAVNSTLKIAGYQLNNSGGEIKGNRTVKLEQSSTIADKVEVEFSDSIHTIPSCFYEFAKRYEKEDGILYSGFVAASADKIFESTNAA